MELYNYLDEIKDQEVDIKLIQDKKVRKNLKDRVLNAIDSSIDMYSKDKLSMKQEHLEELVPLAMINDEKRYRRFLESFLTDFQNTKLFEPRKIAILSYILLGALKNKEVKKFYTADDLMVCMTSLRKKIENLAIDSENQNF